MFHCNGWCFPWAVTAAAATHVCLPKVDPEVIWDLVGTDGITHMCGAPAVLTSMLESPAARTEHRGRPLQFLTGGAAPSPSMLVAVDASDIEVMQAYGLTETHGPAVLCIPDPARQSLDRPDRARMQARQGIPTYAGLSVRVVAADGSDVLPDGDSVGEVWLRGNTLMLGYFQDDATTASALAEDWFRTGDIAVLHPDGQLELRDRKKDVIISGGENITSIEVEQAIASHPAVLEVAVVGVPDQRWGEVPVAHVQLRDNQATTEQDIIEHVRKLLARFKTPNRVIFGPLPRTATGKIQTFALREAHRSQTWHPADDGVTRRTDQRGECQGVIPRPNPPASRSTRRRSPSTFRHDDPASSSAVRSAPRQGPRPAEE